MGTPANHLTFSNASKGITVTSDGTMHIDVGQYWANDAKQDAESRVLDKTGDELITNIEGAKNFTTIYEKAINGRMVFKIEDKAATASQVSASAVDAKATAEKTHIYEFLQYNICTMGEESQISTYHIHITQNTTTIYKKDDDSGRLDKISQDDNKGTRLALGTSGELRLINLTPDNKIEPNRHTDDCCVM